MGFSESGTTFLTYLKKIEPPKFFEPLRVGFETRESEIHTSDNLIVPISQPTKVRKSSKGFENSAKILNFW